MVKEEVAKHLHRNKEVDKMQTPAVELRNITKIFRSQQDEEVVAVDNFDFEVQDGEMITLLGPSGCGKTTILRIVAGFEEPNEGKVLFNGENVIDIPPNERSATMVFQNYGLFPHMNVKENVTYGLRFEDIGQSEIENTYNQIMDMVGLSGYEDRSPGELSGGQQQRVALARSLIVEPNLLLFDEPLSNLDKKLRETMREEIRKLQRKLEVTSIYVTHDQVEAMSLSDRIVVINAGEEQQIGTPEEIYYRPKSMFVAGFIGEGNFWPVELVELSEQYIKVNVFDEVLKIDRNNQFLDHADTANLVLRPESLQIKEKGEGFLAATVAKKTFLGSYYEYILELGSGANALVHTTNPQHKRAFKVGEKASLYFDAKNVHLLPN